MKIYGIVYSYAKYDDMTFAVVAESYENAVEKIKKSYKENYELNLNEKDLYLEFEKDIEEVVFWHRSFD